MEQGNSLSKNGDKQCSFLTFLQDIPPGKQKKIRRVWNWMGIE
jgi:hypothetical protein